MKNRTWTHALLATMITAIGYVGCSAPPPEPNAVRTPAKGCSPGTTLCSYEDGVSQCYNPATQICCEDGSERIVCSKAGGMVCSPPNGCVIPPPPPVAATVNYMILGLYYTPPGKGSQVGYASGFDVDTETDISKSFQTGLVIDMGTNAVSLHS